MVQKSEASQHVGSTYSATVSYTLANGANGGLADNYSLANSVIANAAITARTLTVTATGVNRAYDGTTNATVNLGSDKVGGDDVTLAYATAYFTDIKDFGNAKPVQVDGISISGGADSGNYTLGNTTASATANVTKAVVTVTSGLAADNKVYDGGTAATISSNSVVLTGVIGVEDVTLNTNGYTANFTNANVGTARSVVVADLSLAGAGAGNYSLTQPTLAADITKATSSSVVASSLNPSGYGDSVRFTNTVSGATPPTGDVIFLVNGTPLSTNALTAGVAVSASITSLSRTTHTITAEYSGDGNFFGVTNDLSGGQVVTNHLPVAVADTRIRTSGFSIKIPIASLIANDTDVDGDALTYVDFTSTNGAVTASVTNILVPANNVEETFTYRVRDNYGGTNTGTVTITVNSTNVFGNAGGQVDKTSTNATVILSGIPGYNYSVWRATNVTFTLGVTNWPGVTAPANGQVTNVDDFSDLFGSPNVAAPAEAYYKLQYLP